MNSEYTGSKYSAIWNEIRLRGWRNSAWRAGYEVRKRMGLVESFFRADPIESEELLTLFASPPTSLQELRAQVRRRLDATFLITPSRRQDYAEAVRRHCPQDINRLRSAADRIACGRFRFMGRDFDFLGKPIDWHIEPNSGRDWPRVRWNRFDLYAKDAPGDVKFTWELNRHQFWPTLGRAYWLTGEARYAQAFADQLGGWIDDNPPEIGVNWRSNLEHGIRLANWWIALAFFIDAPEVSDELLARMLGTLVLKTRHVVADLDYSRINMANNHLLGDAMGLAVMGLALPELTESARWRELGLNTLWQEAPHQIHPDGASFECAVSYHRFVAYFYVIVTQLCRKSGIEVPKTVIDRLQGMFDFVLNLRRPDGGMPSIGDWDNGHTVILSEQEPTDFEPMLSTGAVLFGRPDMAWAAERIDQETIWLLGPEAGDAFVQLPAAPPSHTSRAFPQGGYFISRTGWSTEAHYAVVRNGPFDSHTHADLLNVEFSAQGSPLLVDPGTYTYNGPWAWRTYFRSGRGHNALTVDGQAQAAAHRIFRWLFPPQGRTLAWQMSQTYDYYEGEHNGFRRLPGRPIHRRAVLSVRGEYWLVLDVLLGRGLHEICLPLHFHPSLDVRPQGNLLVASRPEGPGAMIATCASMPLTIATARGSQDPIQGWFSAGYGEKTPSVTACCRGEANLPAWIAWLVVPARRPPTPIGFTAEAAGPIGISPVTLSVRNDTLNDRFVYCSSGRLPEAPEPGVSLTPGARWIRSAASATG